jgi:hypothetical protein
LHFISPAICENDFSSTGEVSIILDPFIEWEWGSGPIWFWDGSIRYLWWGTIPGAICISIYQNIDGVYQIIAECVDPLVPWEVPGGIPIQDLVVTVITDDGGESNPSGPPTLAGNCANIISLNPPTGPLGPYAGCDAVTLGITASGTTPLIYRWFFEGVLKHESGVSSYTFPMAKDLAGLWSVEVANNVPGCFADTAGDWEITYEPLDFVDTEVDPGCADEEYFYEFEATGGTPIDCDHYDWQVTGGALPTGLTLDPVTGIIEGTPTVGGSFSFDVTVTDDEGDAITKTFTMFLIKFTTATPLEPRALENEAYSNPIVATPAGLVFSLTGGALPAGLVLEAGGNITGTPTEGGTFNFTVTATSADPVASCDKDYSLLVWYADNTYINRFGSAANAGAQTNVDINGGVALGPGIYKLTPNWVDLGSPTIWQYLLGGAYSVMVHGGAPLGTQPNHQPTAYLHTAEDGPISDITGAIATCFIGNPACTSAHLLSLLQAYLPGEVARFELEVSRNVKFTWAMRPSVIWTNIETYKVGGIGGGWDITRIGKPTP